MTESQGETPRRRHRTRSEADHLVAQYEASGLSRQAFCDQNHVPAKTLARYLARRRRQSQEAPVQARWLAVEVAQPVAPTRELAVALRNGRRIEIGPGFDAHLLQHSGSQCVVNGSGLRVSRVAPVRPNRT